MVDATAPLLQRREGAVLVLSNNNTAARNALSPAFYAALTAALAAAQDDPAVGAIVLTGEGGHFCAGGDLRQLAKRRELPVEERRAKLEGLHDLVRAVRGSGKPVIAAVEGAAAGAGLSLALACDMLVAARDAVFSVAYVKVGLTPDGGATAFLAEFVSRQVLTELCLTGERISGERLHALGAVNRLAEPGEARWRWPPAWRTGRSRPWRASRRCAWRRPRPRSKSSWRARRRAWCCRRRPKSRARASPPSWKSARPITCACAARADALPVPGREGGSGHAARRITMNE